MTKTSRLGTRVPQKYSRSTRVLPKQAGLAPGYPRNTQGVPGYSPGNQAWYPVMYPRHSQGVPGYRRVCSAVPGQHTPFDCFSFNCCFHPLTINVATLLFFNLLEKAVREDTRLCLSFFQARRGWDGGRGAGGGVSRLLIEVPRT